MRTHGLCLSLTLIAYTNIYWYINRSHFLKDCFMVSWFIFVADGAFCYWCWSHLFSSRKCNTIDIKPNLTCENKINSCVLPMDVEVPGDLAFSDKVQTQVSFFFLQLYCLKCLIMAFILKSHLFIPPQCFCKGKLSDSTTLGVPPFPSNLPPTHLNGAVIP